MNKKTYVICIVAFFIFIGNLAAQQGLIDKTFNTIDTGFKGDGFDKVVRSIALQTDGKLLVAGDYLNFNGNSLPYLSRLHEDGSVDDSFELNEGFNKKIEQILIQKDGKSIVVGSFTTYNQSSIGRVARLHEDGSLDTSLDTSLGVGNNIVYGVAQQPDEKIILVGSFTKYAAVSTNRIVRINPDGSLDSSFVVGTGASGLVRKVCVQADGKILIAGSFDTFNGISSNKMVRLNPDGSVDATFNVGSGFDANVAALDLQADGKILVGGSFTTYNAKTVNRIVRLHSNGSIDNTFMSGTGFSNSSVSVIKVLENQNIMIGGGFTNDYNGTEVRKMVLLNSDGTINPIFDIGSGPATATVYDFVNAPDGSWFVGGSFSVFDSKNRGRLAKLDSKGALDPHFLSAEIGFDSSVYKTISLANKKTMIFGDFNSFNGIAVSKVARLNEDGSLDPEFNTANLGANNTIRTAILQPDGKLIIAGGFTNYNGATVSKIVRILVDGSIDPTFVNAGSINNPIYAMQLQPDGKIVIAGSFTKYNGQIANKISRVLPDGSVDASFDVGLGADGTIDSIVLQPDGKIVLAGHFLSFNGENYTRMVRLHPDGSIDNTFAIGTGFDKNIYTLALQLDGKIVVGGIFQTYNGIPFKRLLRLNADGSLDTSFQSGTGLSNGTVRSLLVQPDGRILIGGTFSGKYNGNPVKRLARLLADGTYDSSFYVDLNSTLYATSLTVDGKLIIAGNFNSVTGVANHRVARIRLCTDTTIWDGASWTNGLPTISKNAFFEKDYTFTASVAACSCSIALDKKVTVNGNATLSLAFNYSGLGTLIIKNNASLYQDEDAVVNTATARIERKTTPIAQLDYTYWSSPVQNHILLATSPETPWDTFFSFLPETNSWSVADPALAMEPGKGYIIRGPQSFSQTAKAIHQANFIGIPHNGQKTVALGATSSHNLVGNPYPSAIDADVFLEKNSNAINGTIYLWSHNTSPIGHNKYLTDDYAVYNLFGGVGTTAPKSVTASTVKPNGKIASGQSFFVTSITDQGVVNFDNSMRIVGANTHFFRTTILQNKAQAITAEKHRIWLNMYNEQGVFKQLLLGYMDGATDTYDAALDGESFKSNENIDFYSLCQDKKLTIQAKGVPFEASDSIGLGYNAKTKGTYSIAADTRDGLFVTQEVYLIDKLTSTTHDLKKGDYSFETEAGTFEDRFMIAFDKETLNTSDFVVGSNLETTVCVVDKQLQISSKEGIEAIKIYDILGKEVYANTAIYAPSFVIEDFSNTTNVFVLKIILENHKIVTKKVLF
ncbi:calcium-binding protein [Flavobacterium crassostreae]|uniref:Calcium-binding protein n=1 Tax=Flavobacterium crassostreae TaxID=1763534 RepID=A0A1B9E0H4_9FLAO|nr:calcium-binding protein [Flavobacterium crassostreae]